MGRRKSNLRVYFGDVLDINGWYVREHRSSADLDKAGLRIIMVKDKRNLYIPFYKYNKVIKIK